MNVDEKLKRTLMPDAIAAKEHIEEGMRLCEESLGEVPDEVIRVAVTLIILLGAQADQNGYLTEGDSKAYRLWVRDFNYKLAKRADDTEVS